MSLVIFFFLSKWLVEIELGKYARRLVLALTLFWGGEDQLIVQELFRPKKEIVQAISLMPISY